MSTDLAATTDAHVTSDGTCHGAVVHQSPQEYQTQNYVEIQRESIARLRWRAQFAFTAQNKWSFSSLFTIHSSNLICARSSDWTKHWHGHHHGWTTANINKVQCASNTQCESETKVIYVRRLNCVSGLDDGFSATISSSAKKKIIRIANETERNVWVARIVGARKTTHKTINKTDNGVYKMIE